MPFVKLHSPKNIEKFKKAINTLDWNELYYYSDSNKAYKKKKLMYRRLSNFLEKNNILYGYQFGFRKNYSTSQAVMEVLDNIYQHCDNHEITVGIYLAIYGVRGTVLKWFESYLSNRKQYTVLPDYESDLHSITCGVPQGSVLGP